MTAGALQLDFGLEELAAAIHSKLFMTVAEVADLAFRRPSLEGLPSGLSRSVRHV
jgi:hypothetical protein